MKTIISIPSDIAARLQNHLFQGELEQGAFLFATPDIKKHTITLQVSDLYLVPADGWQVQLDVYLEMKDSERARIMAIARKNQYAVIDCHSHPGSDGAVAFSPSDCTGIADFAQYAKWKLDGKPFAAIVWGEESVDAVIWYEEFLNGQPVNEVKIVDKVPRVLRPQGSYFKKISKPWWRKVLYGK